MCLFLVRLSVPVIVDGNKLTQTAIQTRDHLIHSTCIVKYSILYYFSLKIPYPRKIERVGALKSDHDMARITFFCRISNFLSKYDMYCTIILQ